MKTLTFATLALALALTFGASTFRTVHAQAPVSIGIPAATDPASADEGSSNTLLNGLEMISITLALISVVILALVIKQFGTSAISVIFGYFIIGTLLLASARLFILFASLGYFDISDETLNLGWHLLFYLSMITFFIAGKGFTKLGAGGEVTENFSRVLGWGLFNFILVVLIFVLIPTTDKPFTAFWAESIYANIGVFHIIALTLGGLAGFYLFRRAKVGQVTALLATPYLVSFTLFALNHFWEMLVESWKVIVVPPGVGEKVEQVFVLPAFMLIAYAYIRLWTLVRPRA